MRPEDFVAAVRASVLDAAVEDTLAVLAKPPGRRPAPAIVELSAWFNTLNEADRSHLKAALELVAHAAVFGFLCVLDGARTVADDHGQFELHYVRAGTRDVLIEGAGAATHELL